MDGSHPPTVGDFSSDAAHLTPHSARVSQLKISSKSKNTSKYLKRDYLDERVDGGYTSGSQSSAAVLGGRVDAIGNCRAYHMKVHTIPSRVTWLVRPVSIG